MTTKQTKVSVETWDKLHKALNDLREAHYQITTLWLEKDVDDEIGEILSVGFPYSESFDELYMSVVDWVESYNEIYHFALKKSLTIKN